jgi:hypothetical protein
MSRGKRSAVWRVRKHQVDHGSSLTGHPPWTACHDMHQVATTPASKVPENRNSPQRTSSSHMPAPPPFRSWPAGWSGISTATRRRTAPTSATSENIAPSVSPARLGAGRHRPAPPAS